MYPQSHSPVLYRYGLVGYLSLDGERLGLVLHLDWNQRAGVGAVECNEVCCGVWTEERMLDDSEFLGV